jgi:ribonuclease III
MKSELIDRAALEDALGHAFRRRAILDQALTHSSFAREAEVQMGADNASQTTGDNEQLEFLGDAVLSFVVSQELFQRFPEYAEGDLSKLRAHVVSARALVRPARQLEIGKYLRFGKGEEKSGGRSKSALLVNALEALIAALFLDAGIEKAHQFVVAAILQPGSCSQSKSTFPRPMQAARRSSAVRKEVPRSGPSRALRDRHGSIYNHCRQVRTQPLRI